MFANILTVDDKYFLLNRDSLKQPIPMQYLKSKNLFRNLLLHFWKLDTFSTLSKEDQPHNLCISHATESEKLGLTNL